MNKVISKDGTTIAYDQSSSGPALITVAGALGFRSFMTEKAMADLLANFFTVINYDRRGRGDSGDNEPYAVDREIDDIEKGECTVFHARDHRRAQLSVFPRCRQNIDRLAS